MGDVEKLIKILEEPKDRQIECYINDFDTGYSSLTYLKKLAASLIKIDRSFVQDLYNDKDNRSIANMMIEFGNNLNMNVIAEELECQEGIDWLYDLDCKQYQGIFFCKPIAIDQFIHLLTPNNITQSAQKITTLDHVYNSLHG